MKNLNKVLAMLVVFVMMLSTVAFASSFTDVADTSSFSTAIEVGVDLGIIKGYTDGTFAPEGEITRAEFAAIVVRLLGQEAQAEGAKATTQFVDVPADHWAAGYINIATQAKVINGYGDGNFGPEDLVEYQDAITMIVRALGYEPAIGSAGYPTGYLTKAGELGLTSNVNGVNGVAINRGTVAQIAFNALDVPLMTQSGYGTFTQYVVNDGYSATTGQANVKKTLLSENYDIVKVHGVIESSTDATSTSATGTDKVTVSITNGLYNKFDISGTRTMEVGTSEAMSYVGKKCVIFVEYDEFKTPNCTIASLYEIVNDDSLVINMKDVEAFTLGSAAYVDDNDTPSNKSDDTAVAEVLGTIKYEVEGSKTSKISTFSGAADVYYNGINLGQVANIDLTAGADVAKMLAKSGSIELVNLKNSTADFDTLYITSYDAIVIDEVRESAAMVINKTYSGGLNRISYSEEDGDVKASLTDAAGAELDWASLEENDVVVVKYVLTTAGKAIYEAAVVENVVTGTVTEVDTASADKYVVIDGTEYKVLTIAEKEKDIKVGDEGTYYLTDSGIVWHEATISVNNNYGFVIAAQNEDTANMKDAKIKMLTKEGDIITFNVASKIYITKYNINSNNKYEKSTSKIAVDGTFDLTDLNNKLITYKVDSSNTVNAIEVAATSGQLSATQDVEDYFTQYAYTDNSGNLVGYDPDDMSFKGGLTLTEDTVVFDVTADDSADWEVVSLMNLMEDDQLGGVKLYNVDDDDNIGAIVITNAANTTISGSKNAATFITGYAKATDEDGNEVYNVKGFVNGAEVSYVYEGDATALTVGTLYIPEYKANGDVKQFTQVTGDASGKNNNTKQTFYAGTLYDQNSSKGRIYLGSSSNVLKVPSAANVYVYDAMSNNRVKYELNAYVGYIEIDYGANNVVGGSGDNADTWYIDKNDKGNALSGVTVYAYEYDGDIVDVVYYISARAAGE